MLKQATVLAAALALAAPAAAQAGFKEPVHVIWQRTGTTPGGNFGWAVSGLADVNHDGADDAIVGEPFPDNGTTWVLSGATGAGPARHHPGRGGGRDRRGAVPRQRHDVGPLRRHRRRPARVPGRAGRLQ